MNIETGEIVIEEKLLKMDEHDRKKYVPLTQELAEKMKKMNRKGRRKYYKTHREEFV